MNTRIYLILLYTLFSGAASGQNRTKIYFIEKINSGRLFEDPKLYNSNMKLQSAGVELYKYRNGIKQDSLFVMAENFRCWADSIAFNVDVPNRFLTNDSKLTFNPRFYFKKNNEKGGLPLHLVGKEQSVIQILLKIKSDPSGAQVYLVPKFYWERNPALSKLDTKLLIPYLVSEGVTTVSTYVQEYVYMAVFQYKGRFSIIQIAPNHLHPLDSVFRKVN